MTGEVLAPVERTCRRCGTDAGGAAWCPACGLNLRAQATSAPAFTPAAPARRRLSGSVILALVVVGLLAVAAIAAVFIFGTGGTHTTQTVIQVLPARPVVRTVRATPAAQPIAKTEIASLLADYQAAYSAEDITSLALLFAPNLERQNGNEPVANRAHALDTYQQQFDALTNPSYVLSNIRYKINGNGAVVTADYSIASGEGVARGRIGFDLVRRDGRLMIDAIRTVPTQ